MQIALPQIYPVASHTDNVGTGTTFVAIPGTQDDGCRYISLALQRGATTIVIQEKVQLSDEVLQQIAASRATLKVVPDCRQAITQLIAQALGHPAKKLKLIGITGTKGKTSTSYMIHHLLSQQGYKVALISTAEKLIGSQVIDMDLTTPLPEHLHMFFDLCLQQGVDYVVMEVSAQSLTLHRVDGLEFVAGAFTNFSLEHLEFYANMDDYLNAKKQFLSMVKSSENLFINYDDPYGKQIVEQIVGCQSYSLLDDHVSWHAQVDLQQGSVALTVQENNKKYTIQANLVGQFNAYNLLVASLIAHQLGMNFEVIRSAASTLSQIPGRMEQYPLQNGAICCIDYAHNPSSYEAVLSTLRSMTSDLIVVFGAGGARDASKRPMMAGIVEKYCNLAIVTSDNPRNESADTIADDIVAGFVGLPHFRHIRQLDRAKAIELACQMSQPGSLIAVLGKGRDEYQIIGSITHPFSEREIIQQFVK